MQLLRNYVMAIPNCAGRAPIQAVMRVHKCCKNRDIVDPAKFPKATVKSERRLGLEPVLGGNWRGLLALFDNFPMLGVLHPTACQARVNNWDFNGEPAVKLQL